MEETITKKILHGPVDLEKSIFWGKYQIVDIYT